MGVSRSSTSSKSLHLHGNDLEKLYPWSFLPNFQASSLERLLSPVVIDYRIPREEASDSPKFSEPPLSLLDWVFQPGRNSCPVVSQGHSDERWQTRGSHSLLLHHHPCIFSPPQMHRRNMVVYTVRTWLSTAKQRESLAQWLLICVYSLKENVCNASFQACDILLFQSEINHPLIPLSITDSSPNPLPDSCGPGSLHSSGTILTQLLRAPYFVVDLEACWLAAMQNW